MEIKQTLYVTNPKDWRKWLKKHYKTEKEIWLVYPKKATGKPRITYNDAVEEALCFGWIDSIVKKRDEESTAQRFSPRKPNAKYSQANIERLRTLVAKKKVTKAVAESIKDVLNEKFKIPPDISKAIKANQKAWKNFQKFSDSYKRIRIAFIEGARNRPQEFKKR
ncbi:MAG TPA: YdeI/OmpD-associated family protein, partial [Anaerolineales bacterium]|nr:YdeI/OmpD-associated family protein [Anaerolineales bacterium]